MVHDLIPPLLCTSLMPCVPWYTHHRTAWFGLVLDSDGRHPHAPFSVTSFDKEVCHIRYFLLKTLELTGLSPLQLSVPFMGEIDNLSIGDTCILPLLGSIIHAMSAMGSAMEAPRLQVRDLQSCIAKFSSLGTDHSSQLGQIQLFLHDLSHRMTHLPSGQAPQTPTTPIPRPPPAPSLPLVPPPPEALLHPPY